MPSFAFFAPLKSPRHPVPSGDRELAAGIQSALKMNSLGYEVDLTSELRCYDGEGNSDQQQKLITLADAEVKRLLSDKRRHEWCVWVTYHNYYKAPDLLGPAVCQQLNIPYVLIEASRSSRRLDGSWFEFAARAEAACDQAATIFYLTDRDHEALEKHRPSHQCLIHLAPFLNQTALAQTATPVVADRAEVVTLLAVGMHRGEDKLASYNIIAQLLPHLATPHWHLEIAGDGPAHAEVRSMFAPFGERVSFLGQVNKESLASAFARATVFIWPGVNEAFGMVYLEAQAAGLPVVAQDRPGVREVLSANQSQVLPGSAVKLAQAIDKIAASTSLQAAISTEGRDYILEHHLLGSAATLLSQQLEPLVMR